eukprot:SAG25_NODE_53_length_18703_cov_126.779104_13_plen_125_part_00
MEFGEVQDGETAVDGLVQHDALVLELHGRQIIVVDLPAVAQRVSNPLGQRRIADGLLTLIANTFLICFPISFAFIDYRPGAAATIDFLSHSLGFFGGPAEPPPAAAAGLADWRISHTVTAMVGR